MEALEKMTSELSTAMNEMYQEYLGHHKELDSHRGKPIADTDLPEVNRILKDIQLKFGYLYPVFQFIATHHQFANTATDEYNKFIDDLVKHSGAKKQGDDEPTKA